MEGSKVNCFRRNLAQNEHNQGTKKCSLPLCIAQDEDCEDVQTISSSSQFSADFVGNGHSFNGAWLPCRYTPVGVTRTCFIDS